jgi:hypothetical protein
MVHTKNYVYFANERISDFWWASRDSNPVL